MFLTVIKVLVNVKLILLYFIFNVSLVLCAPVLSAEDICSVNLVPKHVIAKRFQESLITIRCEATLEPKLFAQSFRFQNPVFDLSFGGTPRTGIYYLRGNTTCDNINANCWSVYTIQANSVGHLIQNTGNIAFSCQVADALTNGSAKSQARCDDKGYMEFRNTLKYGDSCSVGHNDQECDQHMDCRPSETETEAENNWQCICVKGYTNIPLPNGSTICLTEVSLGLVCNHTKQCSATDPNSVCDYNTSIGDKVCKCNEDSYEWSEHKSDYIKKCRILPKLSSNNVSSISDEELTVISIINDNIEHNYDKKSEDLKEGNNFKVSSANESTGSVGIILFFVAILLAVLIVVIIIRVRNKSDKTVMNNKNKKTCEQQTDDNDGEQCEPILDTDDKIGTDEVDEDDSEVKVQTHNQINSINGSKVQTNV